MNELNPKTFVTFACSGASGHTIIAAILDAHPNCMIGEEKKVIHSKWPKDKVFQQCFKDSQNRVNSTKCYRNTIGKIPDQWQGKYHNELLVLGDKCGWDVVGPRLDSGPTTRRLNRFRNVIKPTDHKVIHVIRNPFDIVSAWHSLKAGRKHEEHKRDINKAIDLYEKYARLIQGTYYEMDFPLEKIIQIRNEDLCRNPEKEILKLSEFLELPINNSWLESSMRVVRPVHRRINEVIWPTPAKKRVDEIIKKYWFLDGYEF